jgi:hypothetical protein
VFTERRWCPHQGICELDGKFGWEPRPLKNPESLNVLGQAGHVWHNFEGSGAVSSPSKFKFSGMHGRLALEAQVRLVQAEPRPVGDERWDALFAALGRAFLNPT